MGGVLFSNTPRPLSTRFVEFRRLENSTCHIAPPRSAFAHSDSSSSQRVPRHRRAFPFTFTSVPLNCVREENFHTPWPRSRCRLVVLANGVGGTLVRCGADVLEVAGQAQGEERSSCQHGRNKIGNFDLCQFAHARPRLQR